MSLLFGTSYGMYNPIFPVFATSEVGASYTDLGVIGTVTFLPYVLVPLLMGVSMDRVNSRYLLTAGFVLEAVSVYMTVMATTLEEIMLWRFVSGFAHALIWPPALHVISHDPVNRVRHTAMFTMCFVVGYMVGPLIGSLILDATNTDYLILFTVAAYAMGLGVVSILLNYPHRQTSGGHLDLSLFKDAARFPVLVIILLYSTVTFGLVLTLYPADMSERGLDGPVIMQLYAVFGITRIVAFLLAKQLAGNRGRALMLSTACVTGAMAISLVGSTAVEFALAMLLLGFGFASIYPLALDVILASSKKIASERMVGAYEAMFGIGWTVGPLSTGYLGHSLGLTSLYWILFAFGLGVLLLAFLFRNKMHVTINTLKYNPESRRGRIILAKQTLKNHFSTILVSAGIMDKILKKADASHNSQDSIQEMSDVVISTAARAHQTLDAAADLLDAKLAEKIRKLLSHIEEIEPASGVGSGYPDYNGIKKEITYITNRLDIGIDDDAVLK